MQSCTQALEDNELGRHLWITFLLSKWDKGDPKTSLDKDKAWHRLIWP